MRDPPKLALGLAAVVASMGLLFTVPRGYFTAATFLSTGCMMVVAYSLRFGRGASGPKARPILVGAGSAVLLYLVFYLGAAAIDAIHPLGVTSASEASIYSLIVSPSNPLPLQAGVLLFDSAGYESFFRGVLQARLQPRLGLGAAPVVALFDASLHALTLNPVWVVATFVTDLIWGLTYRYGGGSQASFSSHLLWDIAIFIIAPVK